ncbi:NAD(P)H-binding protein [Nocardia sp. 004]|uniref:NAD(P)H-binding protein n=1 Tax=Nocardia sp. 004 TaxID=3385978 RepID=UPI0039A08FE2
MILVTGAGGRVGGSVVAQLRARGEKVRALVRDPRRGTPMPGVEVVRGDLTDPVSVAAAMDSVRAVVLVWPTLSADAAAPATIAAIAERAERVVYLSANGVTAGADEGILGSHAMLEGLLEDSGMDWTFLRPSGFAANTLGWAGQIRDTGVVRWIHGAARRSLIDERDIAAVAVRAATESGHVGQRYVLTGSESLTHIEQVAVIGTAIGRPIRFEEIDPDTARRTLFEDMPPQAVDGILAAHAAMVAVPEPVTDTVARITGNPARSFSEWAAAHAAEFA